MLPPPGDPLPPPTPTPRPGRWQRFQRRPRWQRWSAYGGGAVLVLAAIGGVVGERPDDSDTVTDAPPITSPASTTATSPETIAVTTTTMPSTTTTSTTTTSTTTTSTTTTSTVPVTEPPTTVPGSLLALDVLALIPVTNENQTTYDRDRFGYPADLDGDGCDTRAEVLQRDSLTPAQVDPSGCQVIAGDWYSSYDGLTHTDPAELEIDHVVALSEAWDSGAWAWGSERLVAYGNDLDDPRSLRAVTGAVNTAKGDKDPSNWLPPNPAAVCTFLADWISIKARWGLTMDQSEAGRIRNVLADQCPGQLVAPWPAAPADTPPPTIPPTAPPPIRPATPQAPAGNCDPSYPTVCIPSPPPDLDCGDIPYRRFTVLPPDPHRFDGTDNDGIGCESG
jgi:Protein of unknown function (DUF1524)